MFGEGQPIHIQFPVDVGTFFAELPLQRPHDFNVGLAFVQTQPTLETLTKDAAAFATSLGEAFATFSHRLLTPNPGGLLLWLPAIGAFDLSTSPRVRMRWTKAPGWSLDAEKRSCLARGGGATSLWAQPIAEDGTSVTFPSGSICLGVENSVHILAGTVEAKDATFLFEQPTSVTVSLQDGQAGNVAFGGTAATGFSSLTIGFVYWLSAMPGLGVNEGLPVGPMVFPLLDPSAGEPFGGLPVSLAVTPAQGVGQSTIVATIPPYQKPFASSYRTSHGQVVSFALTTAPLALVSVPAANGVYVLQPIGEASIQTTFATGEFLLAGLSGCEGFIVANGDLMNFATDEPVAVPAGVWLTQASSAGGPPGMRSAPTAPGPSVKISFSPTGSDAISYAVQSQQAPLYDGGGVLLSALGAATTTIPLNEGKTPPVPMLPYGGVTAQASGLGATAAGYAAFEASYIAPARSLALDLTSSVSGSVNAVTPQGFVATFSGGALTGLQFATLDGQAVGLSASGGLPSSAQDLFLSSQPFIVISQMPPDLGFTSPVMLDGWCVGLTPAVTNGQFGTIMIVKAAGAPVAQLAGTPSAWTGYGDFNDTDLDPKGEVLSLYLTNYFNAARRLYAGGTGMIEMQPLLELIDDPGWSGVLFISPVVNVAQCDPDLQAILVGAEGPIVFNHLAVASNHLTGTATTDQTSSFFGLVAYARPGTPTSNLATGSGGFVSDSLAYDFQLLTLKAVFENSVLTSFQSQSQLVLNDFFGEWVLQMPAGATVSGTNTVPLVGSAHEVAGATSYTLAVPSGYVGTFYLNSAALDMVTLDRVATYFVPPVSPSTSASLTFTFDGWLGTGLAANGPDLLSYAVIAFTGYKLAMEWDVASPGTLPSFVPDISKLALLTLQEQPVSDAQTMPVSTPSVNLFRPNSLGGQMPTTVNQLLIGDGTVAPTAMGFLPIKTTFDTSADSVSFTDPWRGIVLDLALGNDGSAGTRALLSGQVMLAWNPGGSRDDMGTVAPFFRIAGPDGFALTFNIEGVLKFGPKSLTLTTTGAVTTTPSSPPQFVLSLDSIGLTVLSTTYPQQGTANLYLAGYPDLSGNRRLGWFGGYSANQTS